ncbi:MAG: HAD family hydrolase [Candidatus Cloacimonetes bacterium]|nr:HAD family hydrolase [Candidatus Cloacimonadota bacterium]
MTGKAVFLDRDGTVNVDINGYITKPDDFELYPFSSEAVSMLNRNGFLVFIVTNQSGIARDYYTKEDLESIHEKMITQLARDHAKIDAVYYSPYHQDGSIKKYAFAHEDRKPGLGMFEKAKQDHKFDPAHSYMIGDKYTDIQFGKKAGLHTILVLTGDGKREFMENRINWSIKPDYIAPDLLTAVKLLCQLEAL